MNSSLFNILGGGNQTNAMATQFEQFKRTVQGDPKQMVQGLLNSGRMTQAQFDEYARIASSLANVLK